jgi:hypothetical protein
MRSLSARSYSRYGGQSESGTALTSMRIGNGEFKVLLVMGDERVNYHGDTEARRREGTRHVHEGEVVM